MFGCHLTSFVIWYWIFGNCLIIGAWNLELVKVKVKVKVEIEIEI